MTDERGVAKEAGLSVIIVLGTYLCLTVLYQGARLLGVPHLGLFSLMVISLAAGAYAAARLRVRSAFFLVGGAAAAMGAELVIRLAMGYFPQGRETHLGILASAYIAMAAWQFGMRPHGPLAAKTSA